MVLEAIRLGCTALGFSGHSYTAFDDSYCMSKAGTREYIATIRDLQEKYRGKIEIRLGIEQDYYSDAPTDEYDYVIGSVHYVNAICRQADLLCFRLPQRRTTPEEKSTLPITVFN